MGLLEYMGARSSAERDAEYLRVLAEKVLDPSQVVIAWEVPSVVSATLNDIAGRMWPTNLGRHKRERLECLERRAEFLRGRIEQGGDLTYDKAEHSALVWAVQRLREVGQGEGEKA